MKRRIDIESILTPIAGENPGGEDLRYSREYDEIKEARRFDDPLDQGEWKTEIKKADWDKVINVAVEALTTKTKDLQIAVWLAEALIVKEGFEGCVLGLQVISGLLSTFWDHLYPEMEDGDLEYRVAPLELMNERFPGIVQQAPVTDPGRTAGYSWLKWQESRQVGYDAGSRDQGAREKRDEAIGEGKITADEFDAAVATTSSAFYKNLSETLNACLDEFGRFDALVDQAFGREAPRVSDLGRAIEDVSQLIQRICKDKGIAVLTEPGELVEELPGEDGQAQEAEAAAGEPNVAARVAAAAPIESPGVLVDIGPWEQALWDDSMRLLRTAGIGKALEKLMEASLSSPSIRGQSRYKLLAAKLCLQAGRPELARPILEQLFGLIDALHLDQWESPVWIADVLGSLYQCLTSGDATDDDLYRAQELFQRLCTVDVTKAITYRR